MFSSPLTFVFLPIYKEIGFVWSCYVTPGWGVKIDVHNVAPHPNHCKLQLCRTLAQGKHLVDLFPVGFWCFFSNKNQNVWFIGVFFFYYCLLNKHQEANYLDSLFILNIILCQFSWEERDWGIFGGRWCTGGMTGNIGLEIQDWGFCFIIALKNIYDPYPYPRCLFFLCFKSSLDLKWFLS